MASNKQETCPAELPNWCAQRHWGIFWILILTAVAVVAARVMTLGSLSDGVSGGAELPFFSANDRSRWITVRSLVDHGTFEIDEVVSSENGKQWDTIDKVRQVGRDGRFHFYSSKPPLLSVVTSGGYWLLKHGLGWEIRNDTTLVVRTLLLLINVVLWGVYLWFAARMINSVPVRDWARYFVLGCAGFGTFLGSFTITLNNHLPAAVFVMMALYFASEIVRRGAAGTGWKYFAATGFLGAAAVANELPALAFLAMLGLICFWQSIRYTLIALTPAAALVLSSLLACNWWALGEFRVAYDHRSDGPMLAIVTGDWDSQLNRGELPPEIRDKIPPKLKFVDAKVEPGRWPSTPQHHRRWVLRDAEPGSTAQLAIVSVRQAELPPAAEVKERNFKYQLCEWGNWYDYPGSYWLTDSPKKSEIDRGQPDTVLYAFHLLFGHHGIFSLTPLWLLSFAGMFALIGGVKLAGRFQMRWLGWTALVVTVVVVVFYVGRPTMDRNYGGVCCTARWLLWLVPIWLITMLPVVDWLGASRWGKGMCFLLLLVSSLSALVHADNPWTFPWLFEVWHWTGIPR